MRSTRAVIRAAVLGVTAVVLAVSPVLADQINGDADSDAILTPHANAATVSQMEGTTAPYAISALIKETGNADDNVFPGTVTATITRSGTWLGVGSTPASFSWTAYDVSRSGTVVVSVPCGTAGTSSNVTAVITAGASSNGQTLGNQDSITLTYTINATPNSALCAPSNTPPVVTVTGVTNGASYNKGSVPAAGCNVVDAEDSGESATPVLSAITGPDAANGIGSQTATCTYTDGGGITRSASATYTITDGSGPTIDYLITGTLGDNGWYTSNVTLTWTVTEADSPSTLVKTGCVDQTLTADQDEATYSCSATSAGGSAGPVDVKIKIDATAPTITPVLDISPDGTTGWFNIATGAPTVSYTCDDGTGAGVSGIASCTGSHTFATGADQSHSGTAVDNAGNSASDGVTDIDVDLVAPTITAALDKAPAASGWFNIATGAPTVTYTCGDTGGSTLASCGPDHTFTDGEDQSHTGTALDVAGNSATDGVTNVDVDTVAPGITWNGWTGVWDQPLYFGNLPAAPTCTATDGTSGPKSCVVSAVDPTVGTHTLTANAEDNAGNTSSESRSYTVNAWTLKGFYQPVDMGGVVNTVKGGSTVPLKFEVFAGPTELTSTSVVKSLAAVETTCSSGATVDDIEVTATGGTSLRYDTTGGQFIYNWQTPKPAGRCYTVTLTTQDGSTLVAKFKTK